MQSKLWPTWFWRLHRSFLAYLLLSCCILYTVAAWPMLCDWLAARTGLDLRPLFGINGKKVQGRTAVGKLFVAWLVLTLVYYGLCLKVRQSWVLYTLSLVLAVVYNASLLLINNRIFTAQKVLREVTLGDYFERQIPALQRLKILEYPAVNLFLEMREQVRKRQIQSFSDLHRFVMEGYQDHEQQLARQWSIQDKGKLKTLYIMNFVAGMWALGNKMELNRPGGVLFNEEVNFEEQTPSLRAYLAANIGCCTDFAHLTKCLLDHEGIANQLTEIPGHIFNEVKLGERWCVLDATANIFLDMSWDELYALPEPGRNSIPVHVFPHPGLVDETAPQYRPLAGQHRVMTLVRIANRPLCLQQTEHPALPAHFD